jgi:hypothetical protein
MILFCPFRMRILAGFFWGVVDCMGKNWIKMFVIHDIKSELPNEQYLFMRGQNIKIWIYMSGYKYMCLCMIIQYMYLLIVCYFIDRCYVAPRMYMYIYCILWLKIQVRVEVSMKVWINIVIWYFDMTLQNIHNVHVYYDFWLKLAMLGKHTMFHWWVVAELSPQPCTPWTK